MSEVFTPDNFISDKAPRVVGSETVAQVAATYLRGQIFGIKTDNKLYALSLAATDGAEKPYFVIDQDIDATAGDVIASGYYAGAFNKTGLQFGANNAVSVYTACRKAGIYPVDFK